MHSYFNSTFYSFWIFQNFQTLIKTQYFHADYVTAPNIIPANDSVELGEEASNGTGRYFAKYFIITFKAELV